jgi:ketosteroid isomerase-like protein
MKTLAALCCVAVLSLGMAACNSKDNTASAPAAAPDTHDADVKAIGDNDAVLMAPGSPSAQGKDAVRAELQAMMKDPALMLQFHASKIDVSGGLGYTQGSYTMKMTNPKTHKVMDDHGSYVTTYRKQADGSWKAVADIATSEVPSMPMPAKKM